MPLNTSLSDMPWFGKPADPGGSFQKGMNLAEQRQRMGQSADMHPLKMADVKSGTAYRDQQTSLAHQKERFNSLNESSRLLLSDAQARSADASAQVAQGTIEAAKGLIRSDRDTQRVKADIVMDTQETAILAADAKNRSAVVDYNVNKDTEKAQINFINANARLKDDEAWLSEHTMWAQYDGAFLANDIKRNALEHERLRLGKSRRDIRSETDGIPHMERYKGLMDAAFKTKDYSLIDDMTWTGVTKAQATELDSYREGRRTTEAFSDYTKLKDHANSIETENQAKALKEHTTLNNDQSHALRKKDAAGNFLYMNEDGTYNDKGKAYLERMSKWNGLFPENFPETEKLKIINAFTNPSAPLGVGVFSPTQLKTMSFSYRGQVNPYGEFVEGEFIPSKLGLETGSEAVSAWNKQNMARLGLTPYSAKVGDVEYKLQIGTDLDTDKDRKARVHKIFAELMGQSIGLEDEARDAQDAWDEATSIEASKADRPRPPSPTKGLSSEGRKDANVLASKLIAAEDWINKTGGHKDGKPAFDQRGVTANQDLDMEKDDKGNYYATPPVFRGLLDEDYESAAEMVEELTKELGGLVGADNVLQFMRSKANFKGTHLGTGGWKWKDKGPVPSGLTPTGSGTFRYTPPNR